ncbi:MAG: hypothetical protein WC501_04465 [Candidatus Micrarchaeia archaeon]
MKTKKRIKVIGEEAKKDRKKTGKLSGLVETIIPISRDTALNALSGKNTSLKEAIGESVENVFLASLHENGTMKVLEGLAGETIQEINGFYKTSERLEGIRLEILDLTEKLEKFRKGETVQELLGLQERITQLKTDLKEVNRAVYNVQQEIKEMKNTASEMEKNLEKRRALASLYRNLNVNENKQEGYEIGVILAKISNMENELKGIPTVDEISSKLTEINGKIGTKEKELETHNNTVNLIKKDLEEYGKMEKNFEKNLVEKINEKRGDFNCEVKRLQLERDSNIMDEVMGGLEAIARAVKERVDDIINRLNKGSD